MKRQHNSAVAHRWPLLVFFGCSLVAVGLAAGLAFSPARAPSELAGPRPVERAPVLDAQFDDARSVSLHVDRGGVQQAFAPRGGRLTSTTCSAHDPMVSGQSTFSLDGQALLNLSTAVPLWRTLHVGDRGSDVESVQIELMRLGFGLNADGVLGEGAVAAVGELLDRIGVEPSRSEISLQTVLWIPAESVTPTSCVTSLGAGVESGAALADLSPSQPGLEILDLPDDLLGAGRILDVGGASVSVTPEGTLTGTSIASFIDTVAGAEDQGGTEAQRAVITGILRLAEPLDVQVVPPSSIIALDEGTGCVLAGDHLLPVDVLGSELGRTFVTFGDHDPPRSVSLIPSKDAGIAC